MMRDSVLGLLTLLTTAALVAGCTPTREERVQAPPAADELASNTTRAVSLQGTEVGTIESASVGVEYEVKIRLPPSYRDSDRTYPVLYLLDGDHAFAMATDIVRYLEYGDDVPELLIASPAYGSTESPENGGTNMRDRDLIVFPEPGQDHEPGGARYFAFLRDELIPYVESRYRADPSDRTLWGYSLGAELAFYALFEDPELFRRVVVVDGFHEGIYEIEARYAEAGSSLPVHLFIGEGEGEENRMEQFARQLQGRGYPSLTLTYANLHGGSHFVVGAGGLARGLAWIFEGERR